MALKSCKECGGQLSTRARACPHCGRPRGLPVLLLVVYGAMIVFILGMGLFYVNFVMGHMPQ